MVSNSFPNKLYAWPKIQASDAKGIRRFSDFLNQIVAAKRQIPELGVLDYAMESAKIVARLPSFIANRWRDVILEYKLHNKNNYPPFEKLAEFIALQSERENIPELQEIGSALDRRGNAYKRSTSSFHIRSKESMENPQKVTRSYFCTYCHSNTHGLNECDAFMKRNLMDRLYFLRTSGLCYGCGSSNEHVARKCTNRATCTICRRSHLTPLHVHGILRNFRRTIKPEENRKGQNIPNKKQERTETTKVGETCKSSASQVWGDLNARKIEQPRLEEKKKTREEMDSLLKPVVVFQNKVDKGADPKSVLCAFFKQGLCGKADKCKFSHDLTVEHKVVKRSLYADGKGDESDNDTLVKVKWVVNKLKEVVEKKHDDRNKLATKPDIVCKHFIQAIEEKKYRWFWSCPNGDSVSMYRLDSLVKKILIKDLEKGERAAPGRRRVTLTSFLPWKKRKKEENIKLMKSNKDCLSETRLQIREIYGSQTNEYSLGYRHADLQTCFID